MVPLLVVWPGYGLRDRRRSPAARMEELGQAGTVQITEVTRNLLGDEFSYRGLGQIDIKGRGELQAYSVTDENRSFPQ